MTTLERLKILREVVARESSIVHSQSTWGIHYGDHDPDDENHCGTIACALGKFALSSEGQEMGFRHEWVELSHGDGWQLKISGEGGVPRESTTECATRIFGITYEQARRLFDEIYGLIAPSRHKGIALNRIDSLMQELVCA